MFEWEDIVEPMIVSKMNEVEYILKDYQTGELSKEEALEELLNYVSYEEAKKLLN